MPNDFSRCSSKECFITGYDVTITAGDVTGTVELQIVDSCNTLHDQCRAKVILVKVLKDWLEDEGESTEILSSCRDNYRCVNGGPGLTYYTRDQKLVAEVTAAAPDSPVTVTVPLPLPCVNLFS